MKMSNFIAKKKKCFSKNSEPIKSIMLLKKAKNIIYIDFYRPKLQATLEKTLRHSTLEQNFFFKKC